MECAEFIVNAVGDRILELRPDTRLARRVLCGGGMVRRGVATDGTGNYTL